MGGGKNFTVMKSSSIQPSCRTHKHRSIVGTFSPNFSHSLYKVYGDRGSKSSYLLVLHCKRVFVLLMYGQKCLVTTQQEVENKTTGSSVDSVRGK